MKKVNISHVSNEHNYWLRSLNFYKTELGILKGMLTEVAGKNTAPDVMKEVEHFENQFKIQAENIDRLAHNIHINIDKIGKDAATNNANYVAGDLADTHMQLGAQFEQEEQIIRGIVPAFRKFAGTWM